MDELKPCPFCGGDATLWREGGVGWFETREEAIAAWNRRVNDGEA